MYATLGSTTVAWEKDFKLGRRLTIHILQVNTSCSPPPPNTNINMITTFSLSHFISAIAKVSDFELDSKKSEQTSLLFKLIDTNNELLQEIKQLENHNHITHDMQEDLNLYRQTVLENKQVLLEQIARIQAINDELVTRGIMSRDTKLKEEQKLVDDIAEKDAQTKESQEEGVYL